MTKLFLNQGFILLLILLNAVLIFIGGFALSPDRLSYVEVFDNVITALFLIEVLVKFNAFGVRSYFASSWNVFDFILIALAIPTLIAFVFNLDFINMSFLLAFRVLRIFKSFRFFRFVKGINHLVGGIKRAMKASVFVMIAFTVFIFIIGVLSFYLFGSVSSEFFGNPLTSLYSVFKLFTIEGWYVIPETVVVGFSPILSFLTYAYFILILIGGGIFGLSIVNSIFVDAMVSDNNDELEKKIDELNRKIDMIINKIE